MIQIDVDFDAEGHYVMTRDGDQFAPGLNPLPAPPALFLGSLAACAGVFAVNYLKTRNLPFSGLKVQARASHAENPGRLGSIELEVRIPESLDARHMKALARSVDLCTLKQTLICRPPVQSSVRAFRTLVPDSPAA